MTYVPDPGDVEIVARTICNLHRPAGQDWWMAVDGLTRDSWRAQASGALTALAAAGRLLPTGWRTAPTSCACGGDLAWLKQLPSGAWEMHGCVCHNRGPWVAVDEGSAK